MSKQLEGSTVWYEELKHCIIDDKNCKYLYGRYLIENETDLERFLNHREFEHCRKIESILIVNWRKHLERGDQLLVSDLTPSGYPSYMINHKDIDIVKVVDDGGINYRNVKEGSKIKRLSSGDTGTVLKVTPRTLTIKWSKSTEKLSFFSNDWGSIEDNGLMLIDE